MLNRAGYPGDISVIIQTRATKTFFIRCWLSLYGWIDKKQIVEFINHNMVVFHNKEFIKFEFMNGLNLQVYLDPFSEISCLKTFANSIYSIIIDTYRIFLVKSKQEGLLTQDIDEIWNQKYQK